MRLLRSEKGTDAVEPTTVLSPGHSPTLDRDVDRRLIRLGGVNKSVRHAGEVDQTDPSAHVVDDPRRPLCRFPVPCGR